MLSSLLELIELVPPPNRPIHTGLNQDITQVENTIGSALPVDYIEYIHHYGECLWYNHIYVVSPFNSGLSSLWGWHQYNIEQLKSLFSGYLPLVKHQVFPEKNGLLLCGGDLWGEHIAWVTDGEPNNWSIVYFNYDCGLYNKYDMNITTFLLKIIKNEIEPDCFPNNIRNNRLDMTIVSIYNHL
jgi:hypothetical protein